MTDAGYDFYADGFCWKYSNYIHYGLTEFGAPELYDSLVGGYQQFSRAPTNASLNKLQALLNIMANSCEEPVKIFLELMAPGPMFSTNITTSTP